MARFITKKWVKVHDQSVVMMIDINQISKEDLKHQCYDQIYVILAMHILL